MVIQIKMKPKCSDLDKRCDPAAELLIVGFFAGEAFRDERYIWVIAGVSHLDRDLILEIFLSHSFPCEGGDSTRFRILEEYRNTET